MHADRNIYATEFAKGSWQEAHTTFFHVAITSKVIPIISRELFVAVRRLHFALVALSCGK